MARSLPSLHLALGGRPHAFDSPNTPHHNMSLPSHQISPLCAPYFSVISDLFTAILSPLVDMQPTISHEEHDWTKVLIELVADVNMGILGDNFVELWLLCDNYLQVNDMEKNGYFIFHTHKGVMLENRDKTEYLFVSRSPTLYQINITP